MGNLHLDSASVEAAIAEAAGNPQAATTAAAGAVKQAPAQIDSVAADVATLKADFNALLAKLRTSGVLHV